MVYGQINILEVSRLCVFEKHMCLNKQISNS